MKIIRRWAQAPMAAPAFYLIAAASFAAAFAVLDIAAGTPVDFTRVIGAGALVAGAWWAFDAITGN